jgi:hypothetical protein
MSAAGRRAARADVSALSEALGASPGRAVAKLDQGRVDDLVALITAERRRREGELSLGLAAAAKKLPRPVRRIAKRTFGL